MAEKEIYAKYIGYYIKNLDPRVPEFEWRKLLREKLGPSVDQASEASLKNLASTLYYAHYANMSSCVRSWEIIQNLKTPAKIRAFLLDSEANRKKYALSDIPVIYYTTDKEIREHMADLAESTGIGIVREVMTEPEKGRKPAVKKPKVPSKSKATPKTKPHVSTSHNYTVAELREMAAKKNITGRSKMNKTQLCDALGITSAKGKSQPASKPRKTCSQYTVTELRKMAAEKNIVGRSKMSKPQLCSALKIKT